ncbi:MAG: ABC transporter substrate-binding protein [Gammaproteobacteria bacterium]|nr:ABC transporter substrate-binding protein [Gammaproteobacteria bacterium]
MSNRSRCSIVPDVPKRSLALLAAGCLSLLAACGYQSDATVIRVGYGSAPLTLDPRFASDATSYRLTQLLFRSPVVTDQRYLAHPELTAWEMLDARTFRFHLPEDARFDDGSAIDADDFIATLSSILDPATASPLRGPLSHVERLERRGAGAVDVHLARPDRLFPGRLSVGLLAGEALDGRALQAAPFSGPFALAGEFRPDRLRLSRRSDGQVFEFLHVTDPTVRALKLVTGELDVAVGSMPPETLAWLDQQHGVEVRRRPGAIITYLGINLTDSALREPDIRRALALAIDRDAIIKHLFAGGASKASAVLPPGHWALDADLAAIDYDPGTAAALLAARGYDQDHPLQLSYKTTTDPFRLRMAAVLQDQLARVGVRLSIESYDWGTFYADVKAGRFQLYSLSWVGITLPDIFRHAFHSDAVPPAGANRGRYHNDAADRLIEAAEVEPDRARQAALYRRLQRLLLDDLPCVPLWYEHSVAAVRNDIAGFRLYADGRLSSLRDVRRVSAE